MKYTIPDSIISQIRSIPSFKTDIAKLKNIGSIKRIYGIGSDEKILSYRVVPKLFAKLETGGAVFTDSGVYCKLPSGYLSSDYSIRKIKYIDMVEYIPALGFTADCQPQLIGKYSGLDNLSFWLTPVAGTESNDAIVDVFDAIIADITSCNDLLYERHHTVLQSFLEEAKKSLDENGTIDGKNEQLLKYQIEHERFNDVQSEDALLIVFHNEIQKGNYADGSEYVLKQASKLHLLSFSSKLEAAARDEAASIGTPDSDKAVEALEQLCKAAPTLSLELLPKIYDYYSKGSMHFRVDYFVHEMEPTTEYENLNNELQKIILSQIQELTEDWKNGEPNYNGFCFLLYAVDKPYSAFSATKLLIEFYCYYIMIKEAYEAIEKYMKKYQDEEQLKELKNYLEDKRLEYAKKRFEQAEDKMKSDDVEQALVKYKQSIELNPAECIYRLNYIRAILSNKNYSLAREAIKEIRDSNCQLDSDAEEEVRTMMIQCAEGFNEAFRPYYNKLINNDNDDDYYDNLFSNDNVYQIRDQLGLSLIHYALLCDDTHIIIKYQDSHIKDNMTTYGYDIRCFATKDISYGPIMMILLMSIDDDAKKLIKKQKSRESFNNAAKIGLSVVSFFVNAAADEMEHQNRSLERMQNSSQYSDFYDDIKNKREELSDAASNARSLDSISQEISEDSERSIDELEKDLRELAKKKVVDYGEIRDRSLDASSLRSVLTYLLITEPSLLSLIYSEDRSGFRLIQSDEGFWYYPSVLLDKAEAMMKKTDSTAIKDSNPVEATPCPEN